MRTLYLFTNEFPYGNWEEYLETEINFYSEYEKVYIFSLQLRKERSKTKRSLPNNCEAIPIYYAKKWVYLINSITVLFDKNLYKELSSLKKRKKLAPKNIVKLFIYLSRAHYEERKIYSAIKKKKIPEAEVFYSYRFEYQPYVAVLLKKRLHANLKIFCRAHGYDLYENDRNGYYIPLRETLLQEIEKVYPCSNNGTDYLQTQFPQFKDKIQTGYLGTSDHGLQKYKKSPSFRIVSCSTATEVKRLDLIVKALALMNDIEIEWTHYGDGPLLNDIKTMARKLPDNIKSTFRGYVSNKKLLEIYKNQSYDLFINVSKHEGLPVTLMEAMSFGLPCAATDVGGVKEIVTNNNGGILIPANSSPNDISNVIRKIARMSAIDYNKMRKKARIVWEQKFDAKKNYEAFIKRLKA